MSPRSKRSFRTSWNEEAREAGPAPARTPRPSPYSRTVRETGARRARVDESRIAPMRRDERPGNAGRRTLEIGASRRQEPTHRVRRQTLGRADHASSPRSGFDRRLRRRSVSSISRSPGCARSRPLFPVDRDCTGRRFAEGEAEDTRSRGGAQASRDCAVAVVPRSRATRSAARLRRSFHPTECVSGQCASTAARTGVWTSDGASRMWPSA